MTLRLVIILFLTITGVAVVLWYNYGDLDRAYQQDMDPIRRRHAQEIAGLVLEYAEKTGHFPFQAQAVGRPFIVFIGHSAEEEDYFANDPVLRRGGQWENAEMLEELLTETLGREIHLPRDPQKVPTYAPNVYVYFIQGDEIAVVCHLFDPYQGAVEYAWRGGTFYSYTLGYDLDDKP